MADPGQEVEPASVPPAGGAAAAGQPGATAGQPDAGAAVSGRKGPKNTLAGRVWVAIVCAAILLVLLIIFIAQNSESVKISFLGTHGHLSLALALLIATVVGILITLLVGSARIVQLTLEVRKHRKRLRDVAPN